MGGALEIAKVVTTVWLHRYWDRVRLAMKSYLVFAVVVLALVTSMGIFGFLSKAHMDQGIPTGDIAAQIQLIDEKITIKRELISSERQNIEAARKTLSQMDAQLTARLDRGDSEAGVERAVQIRQQQRRERTTLNAEISQAQKRIEDHNEDIQKLSLEKAPIAAKYRTIEAEVGPIKYIAALIYGDNPDQLLLDRAVRWVIILLIFVFDPLALCLVIAAISSYKWEFYRKEELIVETAGGYLPLSHSEKEGRSDPLPDIIEPRAGNLDITADGGTTKQDIPVKKKLSERLNLARKLKSLRNLRLPKLSQIKERIGQLRVSNIKKLSLSLKSNLKEKFNWQNLTNWNKSPILNLLKKLLPPHR